MILIVGASGRLGRATALRLLDEGRAVRAAVRRPGKAADLAARGAQVAGLDLRRPQTFPPALAGTRAVLASVQGLTGRSADNVEKVDVAGHLALIDAAEAAGVARFVYVSALGAAPDHPSAFFRAKAQVEAALRASRLDFVILRPGAFMDFHAHELIGKPVLAGKAAMLLGDGRTRRNFVAVADVARLAAEVLTAQTGGRRTLDVAGPDNLTDLEVAELYARLAGRPLKVRRLPAPALRALGAAFAPFHAGAANIVRMPLQMAAAEGAAYTGEAVQPTSLAAFIRARLPPVSGPAALG